MSTKNNSAITINGKANLRTSLSAILFATRSGASFTKTFVSCAKDDACDYVTREMTEVANNIIASHNEYREEHGLQANVKLVAIEYKEAKQPARKPVVSAAAPVAPAPQSDLTSIEAQAAHDRVARPSMRAGQLPDRSRAAWTGVAAATSGRPHKSVALAVAAGQAGWWGY